MKNGNIVNELTTFTLDVEIENEGQTWESYKHTLVANCYCATDLDHVFPFQMKSACCISTKLDGWYNDSAFLACYNSLKCNLDALGIDIPNYETIIIN